MLFSFVAKEIIMRQVYIAQVATLLLIVAALAVLAHAQTWLDTVGVTGLSYNGSGTLIILISTGVDLNNPTINASMLRVSGIPCFVAFDSNGTMYTPQPPYDLQGIGTREAELALQAAPGAKIIAVKVPYIVDDKTGLPTIPPAALRAALEWVQHPYVQLPNGTTVACDIASFNSVILLIGLPVYTNYTPSAGVAGLIRKLSGDMLVVVPVGDAQPGIVNTLAKIEGVVSVAPVSLYDVNTRIGGSGGLAEWKPSSLYRSLPIIPSYVMPVTPDCYSGMSIETVTCSEEAAAEFAGLAALVGQMYYLLRGVNPAPYQLENLIRATVRDLGAPGADSVYGWGLPNARIAHELLSYNAGFIVCAPDYNTDGFAVVELYTPPYYRYSLVMRKGECVYAWALPGHAYQVTVYSSPTIPPVSTTLETYAGYWRRVHLIPQPDSFATIEARVVDERGVSIVSGEVYLLPGSMWPIDQRWLVAMMHSLSYQAGNVIESLSCRYLSLVYGQGPAYLMITAPGRLSRIIELSYTRVCEAGGGTITLGTLTMVRAPSVYVLGYGPGADEDARLLEMLGFRVEVGLNPQGRYDIIIVRPEAASLASYARSIAHGVVYEGDAGYPVIYPIRVTGISVLEMLGIPRYMAAYQPVIARSGVYLYLYAMQGRAPVLTLYNVSVPRGLGYRVLLTLDSQAGRVVEVYVNPGSSETFIANMWSSWRMGRSLEAELTIRGLAALQLAIVSATSPIYISFNGTEGGGTCVSTHPFHKLLVSLGGWHLEVTIWNQTLAGSLAAVASVKALYPNYTAVVNMTVGEVPAGRYVVVANDSLWRLGVACYAVTPMIRLSAPVATIGGNLTIRGWGFHSNAPISIMVDGVAVASSSSDNRGSFYAVITLPRWLTPGPHTIEARDWSSSASATVLARAVEKLDVIAAAPSTVAKGTPIPITILVRLGLTPVDANVTVWCAGRVYRAARLAKGVYRALLPPLPPGSYTVIINATHNSTLVYATGLYAVTVVVQKVEAKKLVAEINRLSKSITASINSSYEKIAARLDKLESIASKTLVETRRMENVTLTVKAEVEKQARQLAMMLGNVENVLLGEVRRAASGLDSKLSTIESKIGSIAEMLSKEASSVRETCSKQGAIAANTVRAVAAQLNAKISRIESVIDRYAGMFRGYVPIVMGLAGAAAGLAAAVLVLCIRRSK